MKKRKIVFASNNAHKLKEAREILGDSFEVVSLSEIGCHDEIPETAETLEGNALIKARWVRDRYSCDCFADDTGLMVDALDGAPGVYSARYAGDHCSPADNVAKLLKEMEKEENRKARFATVIALVRGDEEICFEGNVEGEIAREPRGKEGFGYDPIFIAEESGERFAEMSAEAKNAISHRGRAMRKLRDFLCVALMLAFTLGMSFPAAAESWRVHNSYDGQMERMIDTPQFTYFLGASQDFEPSQVAKSQLYGVLMRYDKENDEFKVLNSQNLLSGNTVVAAEYNYKKKYLAVAYDDGNLDLIYDSGDVVNIPGLKMSSESKKVNCISMGEKEGTVYVATGFGFLTLDESKGQVGISRMLGSPVSAALEYGGKLWLAVNGGIYTGNPTAFNLEDYDKIASIDNVVRMFPLGQRGVLVVHGPRSSLACTLVSPSGETKVYSSGGSVCIEKTNAGCVMGGGSGMTLIHDDGKDVWVDYSTEDRASSVASYNEKDFWFSAKRKGISRKRNAGPGQWTVTMDRIFPNVSSAFLCSSMAYSPTYGLLVRNHGMDQNFNSANSNYYNSLDLLSAYKDLNWKRMSAAYLAPDSKGLVVNDPNGLAVDPKNENHVYCGSVYNGLLRLDLSDINNSIHISKPSDISKGYGQPGFAAVIPDPVADAFWPERCLFSAPAFDSYGTLWTAYVDPVKGHEGSTQTELWYWTAADRAASTSPTNIRPLNKITIEGVAMSNNPNIMPLKSSANKNIIVCHGNYLGEGMIVYDHNGTPDNTSDDRMVKMLSIYDQDGQKVPFNYAYVIFEDESTGLVWICSPSSIFTFNPKEVFSNPQSVKRIKVARNDGTNLADYLLDGVVVNQMLADSQNRKWFATRGAGLMCTSSDGREILKTYTSANSGLLSDVVYSICMNPANNSMMVSTDKGLCELFFSGEGGEDGSGDVRAYPNPVRPDYHGYVTVDRLPENAMVKITDTAGNLIKECGEASGGEALWDLTNMFYRRVPGGIYFILATNGPDSDKYVKVGKVLVVE